MGPVRAPRTEPRVAQPSFRLQPHPSSAPGPTVLRAVPSTCCFLSGDHPAKGPSFPDALPSLLWASAETSSRKPSQTALSCAVRAQHTGRAVPWLQPLSAERAGPVPAPCQVPVWPVYTPAIFVALLQPALSPHGPRVWMCTHPTPLCTQTPRVTSRSVPHHLPVGSEGPAPSMYVEQPQVTSWSSVPTWCPSDHTLP